MSNRCSTPAAGRNPARGSSAHSRASMACPPIRAPVTSGGSGAPSAISSWSRTRSRPVISSVTGCSTWSRVFTSRNQNAPSGAMTNSTVPAPT